MTENAGSPELHPISARGSAKGPAAASVWHESTASGVALSRHVVPK